jgi:hypothetical protein
MTLHAFNRTDQNVRRAEMRLREYTEPEVSPFSVARVSVTTLAGSVESARCRCVKI